MTTKTLSARIILFLLLFLATISSSQSFAAGLLVPTDGSSTIAMKTHHVNVVINNGFAKTEVDQVFFNTGQKDLEALYRFPVPEKASLSEVSLWVNEKELIGEVLPKENAKKAYDDQKAKGNNTALAEQNTHKYFEVKVFPVKANAETRVRLVYYQPLEIDLNIGRYVYPIAEGNLDDAAAQSFWSVDSKVHESFKFEATLKSAYTIQEVRVPGFENKAAIKKSGGQETSGSVYDILIDEKTDASLSKDVVVYYRLADDTPARVELIPYKEAGQDGTFMLVITPGGALQKIQNGTDWTFVLDVSGSMSGDKIKSLAAGVVKTIQSLKPEDKFRVITFNERADDFSGGFITATAENIQNLLGRIGSINSGGSTDVYSGLEMAYDGIEKDRTSGIILVTDGEANVGKTHINDFLDLQKKHDVRLFTFLMGNSANRPLLTQLAEDSGGFAMTVSTSDDIIGKILQAKAKVLHECLYDTRVEFEGSKTSDRTPAKFGNLYKGQQVVLFGKYPKAGDLRVNLKGRIGGEEKIWSCSAKLPDVDLENPEIERLWALSTIEDKMKEIRTTDSSSLKKEVVDLGVEYSLVTEYTSMVVVENSEKESHGIGNKNNDRIQKERNAQTQKNQEAPKSRQVDDSNPESSNSMFKGARSSNIGSGPVGPILIGLAAYAKRRKNLKK